MDETHGRQNDGTTDQDIRREVFTQEQDTSNDAGNRYQQDKWNDLVHSVYANQPEPEGITYCRHDEGQIGDGDPASPTG